MEPEVIASIKCPCCKFLIENYQDDCRNCGCGAVMCPNCNLEIPREILEMAVIY